MESFLWGELMDKYDVMYKNEPVGEAEIRQEGLFTVLRCECVCLDGVMRLYGFCGDDFFPIGIPTPVGSRMRLVKKYTKNDLQLQPVHICDRFELFGADEEPEKPASKEEMPAEPTEPKPESEPVTEMPAEKHESPWKPAPDPSSLFADAELKATAAGIKGGMTAEDGSSTLLAIPISTDTPFPLMPVFRYGWSAMVEGKCCIVFRVRDGYLV